MNQYPPLDDVRRHLKISWYRTKLAPTILRQMTARSNLRGAAQTLGHFILYLATGFFVFWLWSRGLWVAFALAMLGHGVVASFLRGISTHELAHGTVFRTRWLNKFFLNLFSLLNWWNHVDYALSHTYHHRFTLHPEGDREVLLPLKPVPGPLAFFQLCTVNLFIPPGRTFSSGGLFPTAWRFLKTALGIRDRSKAPSSIWICALHQDQPREARRSARWSAAVLVFHAGVVAVGLATGLWVLPLVITVAPFTASIVLYAVSLPQHSGLKNSDPDFRKCARSIRLGPVLEFLYWQMNWHAEHHMYAAVPCYNLKKLARHIAADMPAPRTLGRAWREMRETWRRQQENPDYQFDLELPETATLSVTRASSDRVHPESSAGELPASDTAELESSVGELAPGGLAGDVGSHRESPPE